MKTKAGTADGEVAAWPRGPGTADGKVAEAVAPLEDELLSEEFQLLDEGPQSLDDKLQLLE